MRMGQEIKKQVSLLLVLALSISLPASAAPGAKLSKLQFVVEKYTQFQSNPSQSAEDKYYEFLELDSESKKAFKKSVKNFKDMPQVRVKGLGIEVLDNKKMVLARISPLKSGQFFVEYPKGAFVWTPGSLDADNLASLQKAFSEEKISWTEYFLPQAHAGTVGTILAVVVVAAVLVGLYKLYRSTDKAIQNTSRAAERNLNKVGDSVSRGVKNVTDSASSAIRNTEPAINRAADAVEDAAGEVKTTSQSASEQNSVWSNQFSIH